MKLAGFIGLLVKSWLRIDVLIPVNFFAGWVFILQGAWHVFDSVKDFQQGHLE